MGHGQHEQYIRRSRVSTQDAGEAEEFIRQAYIDNRSTFLGFQEHAYFTATCAESPNLGSSRVCSTVDYRSATDPFDYLLSFVLVRGRLHINDGLNSRIVLTGESTFYPLGLPLRVDLFGIEACTLHLPMSKLEAAAESVAGLRHQTLRFESTRPVSATLSQRWAALLTFANDVLLRADNSTATAVMIEELNRAAALTALYTFPNSALALSATSVDWLGPVSVRRAVEFIETYPDLPLTVQEIARSAGTDARTLRHAFHRHVGVTPVQYMRRVRLERAHAELRDADSNSPLTVAHVAQRWGWIGVSSFNSAYFKRFGVSPTRTLRI